MKYFVYTTLSLFVNYFVYGQSIITTVAGTGVAGYSGDGGAAMSAEISYPEGLNIDKSGNYYFSESLNHIMRKVTPSNIISTFAGTGPSTYTYNGDGIQAINANMSPINAAFDSNGDMYVSDMGNHRIRKINSSGIISTICGTGVIGNSGDGGPADQAEISNPAAIFIDKYDNIYIPDFTNHNIRKIDKIGIITTIAGTGAGGFSGDGGPAISAQLFSPYSVAIDSSDNIYISDPSNRRIRKIDKNGIITSIAGTGTFGYSGDNGPSILAQITEPGQLAIDDTGNIFFPDIYNHVVRKIDLLGVITTVVGNGSIGYSGDGGPALAAQLKAPWGLALDSIGDLYISDGGNNVIRKVTNVGVMGLKPQKRAEHSVHVFPNPNNGSFKVNYDLDPAAKGASFKIFDITGKELKSYILKAGESTVEINMEHLPAGMYFYKVTVKDTLLKSGKLAITD